MVSCTSTVLGLEPSPPAVNAAVSTPPTTAQTSMAVAARHTSADLRRKRGQLPDAGGSLALGSGSDAVMVTVSFKC